MTGAIYPTLRDANSCTVDYSGNTLDSDVEDRTPDSALFSQQAEYVTPYLNFQYNNKVTEAWSVIADQMPDESWCSTFPTVTIDPPVVTWPNICFQWDSTTYELPFSPV